MYSDSLHIWFQHEGYNNDDDGEGNDDDDDDDDDECVMMLITVQWQGVCGQHRNNSPVGDSNASISHRRWQNTLRSVYLCAYNISGAISICTTQ